MTETSKLEKLADIKYLLLIISFILLLDIFLLNNDEKNIYYLKLAFFKDRIGIFLIFICIYSFYIALMSKFIVTFFIMIFELFKVKKKVTIYNIEYYELLTKSFKENNNIIYNYAQDKIKKQDELFIGITFYYGAIILFLFDFFYYENSIVDLFFLKILELIVHDPDLINTFSFLSIIGIIFFILTLIPYIILKDYLNERNMIRINSLIKRDLLEKKYK